MQGAFWAARTFSRNVISALTKTDEVLRTADVLGGHRRDR